MFRLTDKLISREEEIAVLTNDQAGALVVFEGWVRNHNQGKQVTSLEYQVYEALAQKEGEKILREAIHKFNLHHVRCAHRYGHLKIGEAAVWIGATATHRDDAFRATRFIIDEIKLRLPIWKKEHYVSETPEWVFCKDHHTHVHFEESDYYKKQEKVVEQALLKSSRVLVVGAGGLGCPVLMSLASAGVGHIDVVDHDHISIGNLHRQMLYSTDNVGEMKVTIAQAKLSAMNPFIHIYGHNKRVDASNIEALMTGKDLIIDCTDNLETKFLLHDACMKNRIPLVSASIYRYEGQVRTFVPGTTGCLRCSHKETPDDSLLGNCNDFGVLGASVALIGNIQANEAIRYLLEKKNSSMETTYFFDVKTLTPMKIKNLKKEDCPTCDGDVTLPVNHLEIDAEGARALGAIMVDVRDADDKVLDQYKSAGKPVVVCCHRGVRSKRLVNSLHSEGHTHFYSLKGGASSRVNLD